MMSAYAKHFKDIAKTEKPQRAEKHYVLHQTPPEAAVYLELEQNTIERGERPRAKPSNCSKEKFITEAYGIGTIGEAMQFRASAHSFHGSGGPPQSALVALHRNREYRMIEVLETEKEIQKKLHIVDWLLRQPDTENDCDLVSVLDSVVDFAKSNRYGDVTAMNNIRQLVDRSRQNYHPHNDYWFKLDPYWADKKQKQKNRAQNLALRLKKLINEYVLRRRAWQFYCSFSRLYEGDVFCLFCKLRPKASQVQDMAILSICGHLVCQQHYSVEHGCPIVGCGAPYTDSGMIPASQIIGADPTVPFSPFGVKMRAVTDHIINKIPRSEQAIVFVQTDGLRKKLVEALKHMKIPHVDLKSGGLRSNVLNGFQYPTKKTPDKVLILSIGDASAAGR